MIKLAKHIAILIGIKLICVYKLQVPYYYMTTM